MGWATFWAIFTSSSGHPGYILSIRKRKLCCEKSVESTQPTFRKRSKEMRYYNVIPFYKIKNELEEKKHISRDSSVFSSSPNLAFTNVIISASIIHLFLLE
jgi:hypothetical protein